MYFLIQFSKIKRFKCVCFRPYFTKNLNTTHVGIKKFFVSACERMFHKIVPLYEFRMMLVLISENLQPPLINFVPRLGCECTENEWVAHYLSERDTSLVLKTIDNSS